MQKLAKSGYLDRQYTITKEGRKNYSVYSLAEKAINVLKDAGLIENPRRARDIKLTGHDMEKRTELSSICLKLWKNGWSYLGPKDAKIELGLVPNNFMQCMLKSPEGIIYQVYQVEKDIKESNKYKIVRAMSDSNKANILLYKADHP